MYFGGEGGGNGGGLLSHALLVCLEASGCSLCDIGWWTE